MQGFRQMIANRSDEGGADRILFNYPKEFYTFNATTIEEAKGELYDTKIASVVSLRFEANSDLLRIFFESVERNII